MASCTKIEGLMQARIDGELSSSETVVFEQHLAECERCARTFRQHQRASAQLFEALHEDRLSHSLRQTVIDHLPELGPADSSDLATVNWRAKHPRSPIVRRLPVAVAVLLALVGLIIHMYWPDSIEARPGAVGMVTYQSGIAYGGHMGEVGAHDIRVESFFEPGAWFETAEEGRLILALAGPAYVKLNEHSRIRVNAERSLTIEAGEVWFDVGKTGRRFEVYTASGYIDVVGTSFLVAVEDAETVVTVFEGEVHFDGTGAEHNFVVLRRGEQSRARAGMAPSPPQRVATAGLASWTSNMIADQRAQATFETTMMAAPDTPKPPEWKIHWVPTRYEGRRWVVEGIRLIWDDVTPGPHCSYDVYVYDDQMNPLFRGRLNGTDINRSSVPYRELYPHGGPIQDINGLFVRLLPDFSTGSVELPIDVKALGL